MAKKKKQNKCIVCGGSGMVQIAPGIRGIKPCPRCHGIGK